MATVNSTNAGLSNLMETLTKAGSPLASTLSTPALQKALENASTADIVKLSDAALQLTEVGGMFGSSSSDTSTSTSTDNLQALFNVLG